VIAKEAGWSPEESRLIEEERSRYGDIVLLPEIDTTALDSAAKTKVASQGKRRQT